MACDPELAIYCFPDAYGYSTKFKNDAAAGRSFRVDAPYSADRQFFNRKHLELVGLDERDLNAMIKRSSDLDEFVRRLASHRSSVRRRPISAFVEKTPLNVNCVAEFGEHFPNEIFIEVVRDGRAVVSSLVRRGFTLMAAAIIWMYQTQAGRSGHRRRGHVIIRYEDLVEDPFGISARIARRAGVTVDPGTIEERFRTNEFRAGLARVDSWSVASYQGTVRSPRDYHDVLSRQNVAWLEAQSLIKVGYVPGSLEHVATFQELSKLHSYAVGTTDVKVADSRVQAIENRFCKDAIESARFRDLFSVTDPRRLVPPPQLDYAASRKLPKVAARRLGFARSTLQTATVDQLLRQAVARIDVLGDDGA